jgi:hypothetical protein
MADQFVERMVSSQRAGHAGEVRRAAEHLRDAATCILRDLDAGKVPSLTWDLLDESGRVMRHLAKWETVNDLVGIYEAGQEGQR